MPTHTVLAETLQSVDDISIQQTTRMQRDLAEYIDRARAARETIMQAAEDYRLSGIAYNSTPLQAAFGVISDYAAPTTLVKRFLQELAREYERPFIYIEDLEAHGFFGGRYRNVHYTQLTIPASNRLKGVVASLNLVAGKGEWFDEDVSTAHSERLWRFNFKGDGLKVLEAFKETCRTDRVFRILLKLGPLPPTTCEVTTNAPTDSQTSV